MICNHPPELILIAAMCAANRVIGNKGKLPWHMAEDLARFRELTLGHSVIMGRKTWEDGLEKRSLSDRHNIVVSRTLMPRTFQTSNGSYSSTCIVSSLEEAFHQVKPGFKTFIIGGASLYEQTLEYAVQLELTLVDGFFEGDTFFPAYNHLIAEKFHLINETTHVGFQTKTYLAK